MLKQRSSETLSREHAEKYREVLQRRSQELSDFLDLGRIVIAVATYTPEIRYRTAATAGTTVFALDWPRLGLARSFQKTEGSKFEVTANGGVGDFFRAVQSQMRYRVSLDGLKLPATLEAPGGLVVGRMQSVKGGGLFLLCPAFSLTRSSEFVEAVRALYVAINERPVEDLLPEWAQSYLVPGERGLMETGRELGNQIAELEARAALVETSLIDVRLTKHVFASKGQPLVNAVRTLLTRLGLEVVDGPEGRDDLIAKVADGRVFVIEVKGRESRGAAEKDAAQLEKWVSGYFEREGREPKGLLLVNGYCETEDVFSRPETFPHQMLEYAHRKQLALLSTSQLLCLVATATDMAELIEEIYCLTGVLERYRQPAEWRAVISPLQS